MPYALLLTGALKTLSPLRRLCNNRCLFVCLFIFLSVSLFGWLLATSCKNYWSYLRENSTRKVPIKCWNSFKSALAEVCALRVIQLLVKGFVSLETVRDYSLISLHVESATKSWWRLPVGALSVSVSTTPLDPGWHWDNGQSVPARPFPWEIQTSTSPNGGKFVERRWGIIVHRYVDVST